MKISDKEKRKIKKLFKMKKFTQIVLKLFLGIGLFISIKGYFCLTK